MLRPRSPGPPFSSHRRGAFTARRETSRHQGRWLQCPAWGKRQVRSLRGCGVVKRGGCLKPAPETSPHSPRVVHFEQTQVDNAREIFPPVNRRSTPTPPNAPPRLSNKHSASRATTWSTTVSQNTPSPYHSWASSLYALRPNKPACRTLMLRVAPHIAIK
jgi:hypothetical protein